MGRRHRRDGRRRDGRGGGRGRGGSAAAPGLWRVFVAIPLPADLRLALGELQALLPLGRPARPETLHLTPAFAGEQPPERVEALHDALERIRLPAFSLGFAGLGLFGGSRPTVIHAAIAPAPALSALQTRVVAALGTARIPPPRGPYVPHVTLARLRGTPDPAARARLDHALAALQGRELPGFAVGAFGLYRSFLTPAGARHEELASYPLRAGHGGVET